MSLKKRFFFFATLIVILLILQESAFRLIFPQSEVKNFNRMLYSPLISDFVLDEKRFLKNESFLWVSTPDNAQFVHKLNLYGFRDKKWDVIPDTDTIRVAFVGDSFVEGFMALEDETIPRGFQKSSDKDGLSVEAMNFGVGAMDIPEYFALIRDMLPIFKPSSLILVLYANDLPPPPFSDSWLNKSIAPEYENSFVPRVYSVLKNRSLQEPIPFAWTKSPFPFFRTANSSSNPWHDEAEANLYSQFVSDEIASAMKEGRFNPYVVDEHGEYKTKLRILFKIKDHLSKLKEYVTSQLSTVIIVYLPSRSQVSNSYLPFQKTFSKNKKPSSLMGKRYQEQARIVHAACMELGLPFLDLTGLIRDYEKMGERLYWNYDEHMKGTSYLLLGEYIYEFWKQNNQQKQ